MVQYHGFFDSEQCQVVVLKWAFYVVVMCGFMSDFCLVPIKERGFKAVTVSIAVRHVV